MSVQLLGLGGSAFSLTPVPNCWLPDNDDSWLIDLALLTPSCQICCLARECDGDFLDQLSGWCLGVAAELLPEQSLPAFQSESVGVVADMEQSDVGEVQLRISVAADPSAPVVEYDTARVRTRRSSLVRASYQLRVARR